MINITIDGVTKEYEKDILFESIVDEYQEKYDNHIVLVKENGKIRELMKTATQDCELSFITLKDNIGRKAYVRTATMMMIKAFRDEVGAEKLEKIKVEYAIGPGYYCSVKGDFELTDELVERVKKRMEKIRDLDIGVRKKVYPKKEALELFASQGMKDKEKLFRFRQSSYINVYNLDGYFDYFYGYMLPTTGYVKRFEMFAYEEGLILLLPDEKDPDRLPFFEPKDNLFNTLKTATAWNEMMEIDTVGDLNNQICSGELNDVILVQEALMERRIGEIAQEIVNRGGVKFIMIAGPSSSGKTTFSHRLSIQLRTYGMTPHPIALDDYFVNREDTPVDENGNYNFECLEAIDIESFNQDMTQLLAGERVELPTFNFKTGKREYKGNYKQLGPEDVLVIEGIHGLNPKMSYSLPDASKFHIYISALTSLNIDEHNRIPTTDGRLLRRIVRDARTRGANAGDTIAMWPSVRRGEEENIFPFQESADAMFNSVLIYELAVLKPYAEPLLFNVSEDSPEYDEAKRLLRFLSYFLPASSDDVPKNSICREFVGGSCFNV